MVSIAALPAAAAPEEADCTPEPVHRMGAIQRHGTLVLLDPGLRLILACSSDPEPVTGLPGLVPGASALPLVKALQLQEPMVPPLGLPPRLLRQRADGVEILTHRSDEGILVEWVRPTEPPPPDLAERAASLAAGLAAAGASIYRAAQGLAEGCAAVAGYNRVMVYQFHPDWTGEVIAEHRRPEQPPFLGLRFPASDVPAQVRALYGRCPLRVIADVTDVSEPLRHAGTVPDLGLALLRSVAPIHVAYLRNMAVQAALSVAIMDGDRLWGMLVCHHATPRLPAATIRAALLAAAQGFAAVIQLSQAAAAERTRVRIAQVTALSHPQDADATLAALLLAQDGLAQLCGADGAAWVDQDRVLGIGQVPTAARLRALAAAARMAAAGATEAVVTATAKLPRDAGAPAFRPIEPSGMLGVTLPGGRGFLAVFRRELLREVHWGGDPQKTLDRAPDGRLSPRQSFALWREWTTGTSHAWGDAERGAMLAAAAALAGLNGPALAGAVATADAKCRRMAVDNIHTLAELLVAKADMVLLEWVAGEAWVRHVSGGLVRVLGAEGVPVTGRAWPVVAAELGLPARAAEGPEPPHFEVTSPDYGALVLRIEHEMVLCLDDAGDARLFSALLFRDETRGERLGAALLAAARQTELTRQARDAFLRNTSHELRTPLNAIIGFAELLAGEGLPPAGPGDVGAFAGEIVNAGRTLLELVERLLDAARIQAGRIVAGNAEFDAALMMREAAASLASLFAAKTVRLQLLGTEAILTCHSDAGLLRQCVLNLLSNAAKFTPPNGLVRCTLAADAASLRIEVADSGPGVPDARASQIFNAFEQADGSLSRRHGGAGLGLFISRNLIETLGGSLRLEAQHGPGATFVIRLPRGLG